ncbi:hypothetical protein [Salinimonas sediminis]|uniref:Uncharacterized protein n=1 Tax=Salinimonas sediminis TaxID=2303538 RepID=A0A346NNC7_9ALTE|nr:hypothetical protein [Salinimonas sediminis]AXR07034.1 hypothetical protein D0Y50_12145 [Salinimonas sediminis]
MSYLNIEIHQAIELTKHFIPTFKRYGYSTAVLEEFCNVHPKASGACRSTSVIDELPPIEIGLSTPYLALTKLKLGILAHDVCTNKEILQTAISLADLLLLTKVLLARIEYNFSINSSKWEEHDLPHKRWEKKQIEQICYTLSRLEEL